MGRHGSADSIADVAVPERIRPGTGMRIRRGVAPRSAEVAGRGHCLAGAVAVLGEDVEIRRLRDVAQVVLDSVLIIRPEQRTGISGGWRRRVPEDCVHGGISHHRTAVIHHVGSAVSARTIGAESCLRHLLREEVVRAAVLGRFRIGRGRQTDQRSGGQQQDHAGDQWSASPTSLSCEHAKAGLDAHDAVPPGV